MPTTNEKETVRLKVYALLVEETPQSVIAEKTGLPKCKISRIVADLLRDAFIEVKTAGKPIIYRKGKNGNILDKALLQRQVAVNDRGVTQVAPIHRPPTTRIHHLKYRLNVLRVGDIDVIKDTINGSEVERPFLTKHGRWYRNTRHHNGQVQYNDGFISVEWEETRTGSTFYIYPPAMDMTADEIRAKRHEQVAVKVCTDIAAYIQAKARWKLGLPEKTNWKVHYGCDTPQVMRGIADRLCQTSRDKKAMLSDSEGRAEMEILDDSTQAAVWLELPGEVIKLKGSIREIAEGMKEINDVLQEVKTALETTTEISGILTAKEAKKVIEDVKARHRPAKTTEETEPAQASLQYDGVMFG